MLETLTLPYWLAMAYLHAGFTLSVVAMLAERHRPRFAFGVQLALLGGYCWGMHAVYAVVPAIWWPDASAHLSAALQPLFGLTAATLVVFTWNADHRRRRARLAREATTAPRGT